MDGDVHAQPRPGLSGRGALAVLVLVAGTGVAFYAWGAAALDTALRADPFEDIDRFRYAHEVGTSRRFVGTTLCTYALLGLWLRARDWRRRAFGLVWAAPGGAAVLLFGLEAVFGDGPGLEAAAPWLGAYGLSVLLLARWDPVSR